MKPAACRALAQIFIALGLGAGFAAVLPWYYDVYVNWQPQAFPYTIVALAVGIIALTLLALWARGERKALPYVWKILLSLVVFLAALLGVSALINNILGHGNMAAQAAAVTLPLCVAQILALFALFLLGLGRRGGKAGKAVAVALSAALAAGAVYACALTWQGGSDVLFYARYALLGRDYKEDVAMKTRATIYTPEKRAIMMENAQSAPFREEAERTAAKADFYADRIGTLYDMVVAEGLPRYYAVGSSRDPNSHRCKYCGTDVHEEYGRYSWKTDPFGHPWKLQCPACGRWFPSNDFAGYYQLGLDEHGVFQPALAREKNDALVAAGEDGYLKNILYPEKGEGWGVDDGFGYFPGNTYDNGVAEKHIYIGVYIHDGIWSGAAWHEDSVRDALNVLRNAYLYTGEAKYGRAGAILLDRIADFYPDYDWGLWKSFRDDGFSGSILDPVWSNYLATEFCLAYDAFFPMYDDPELIAYLSAKSAQYQQENPKDSGAALRLNVENGILRPVFRLAVIRQHNGNFGITQQTAVAAAVALDTMPETGEWLDWVMATGAGDVAAKLIDVVDRDGMGDEASPSYNSIWVDYLIDIAQLLDGYDTYPSMDLYKNPKFVQMLRAQLPVVLANYYTAQIGDAGGAASTGFTLGANLAITAYRHTGDPAFAQFLYLVNGNSVEGLSEGIGVKDPLKIQSDVQSVIDEYGELNLPSQMMAGYGFAALRNGPKSDFWMYFGSTHGHGHCDSLNLGFDAYGLNMAPELGYPEATGTLPSRAQWVHATISHNTVVVDGKVQLENRAVRQGRPLHFDDGGRVKLMDVDESMAYPQTSEYRRTLVMVEVDGEVSYGVDFFRVVGGDDHIYSFHSQSDEIFETEGLALVPQESGTYAGPDVPWGPDPDTVDSQWRDNDLRYPAGFTWLDQVRRAPNPGGDFAVDFAVKDFRKVLKDSAGLHLRMTQLNGFALSEVALARGTPPKLPGNPAALEYVLARRQGRNLDSLFTTVYEPYKGERYIAKLEAAAEGSGKKVTVTHVSGRIDVIRYRTEEGFVSVEIYAPDGSLDYRYVNDALVYTGKVLSFTKELSLENSIRVSMEQAVDTAALAGQYIYVENDGQQSGAYRIESAGALEDGSLLLDIGQVSPIRGLRGQRRTGRYVYNIKAGQRFRIPMPAVEPQA